MPDSQGKFLFSCLPALCRIADRYTVGSLYQAGHTDPEYPWKCWKLPPLESSTSPLSPPGQGGSGRHQGWNGAGQQETCWGFWGGCTALWAGPSALLPLTRGWGVWRRPADYAAHGESHWMEGNRHFLSVEKEKRKSWIQIWLFCTKTSVLRKIICCEQREWGNKAPKVCHLLRIYSWCGLGRHCIAGRQLQKLFRFHTPEKELSTHQAWAMQKEHCSSNASSPPHASKGVPRTRTICL